MHRHKSSMRMLLFLAAVSLLALSVAAKAVMTWAAYWNYPVRFTVACISCPCVMTCDCVQGGWALLSLQQSAADSCVRSSTPCSVHVDVLPAMTGVSRFGEQVRRKIGAVCCRH